MKFICYPKCTTCIKAKNFLTDNNVLFDERNIKINNPSYEELKEWTTKYSLPINKMFNTSGLLYKELNLKEKMSSMSDEDKIKLLSTNGMLVKRPILIGDDFIIFGFKEEEYKKHIL